MGNLRLARKNQKEYGRRSPHSVLKPGRDLSDFQSVPPLFEQLVGHAVTAT
jgi:hypothetical protein